MDKALLASWVLAGLTCAAAGAAEPSLCTRLADEARQAPAATWTADDPLAAWAKPAENAAPSPTVTALSTDARWRELLGVPEGHTMSVQQLGGVPVYLVDDVAGTANCQLLVLVEARPGRPSRQLKPPFDVEHMDLCMTQSARFAKVLGRPAFVAGGSPSMASPDLTYRMATWTGKGWGQPCSLKLRRDVAMTAGERFCAPGASVCASGQVVARQLAQSYEANRSSKGPLDGSAFTDGRKPDAAIAAALNPPLATPGAIGDMNPPFPLFGADEQRRDPMLTVFSNADPRRLAVFVDGRWWLAVVGRSGVGWREGGAVLVALFSPPGRPGDGVASYQFLIGPAGLLEATAADARR